MDKQIKDYLHLYLGCEVLVEKSSYYLVHNYSIHQGEKHALNIILLNYLLVTLKTKSVIKLLLRPLSDMTEEEAVELARLSEWEPHFRDVKVERNKISNDIIVTWDGMNESREVFNATGELFYCPEQFQWLLSKQIDLFGLIEAGLAIDKTQQSKAK